MANLQRKPIKAPREIREKIQEIQRLKDEIESQIALDGRLKSEIDDFFMRSGCNVTYAPDVVENSAFVLQVMVVEPTRFDYDTKKLRKRLADRPDVLKRIITLSVNPSDLEAEFENGSISLEDLSGCYTSRTGHHLMVRRVKAQNAS